MTSTWKLLLLLPIVVYGCTSEGPSSDSTPSSATGTAQLDDLQREILEDGIVTYDEYERATLATIACVRAAGVEVTDPTPMPGSRLDFEMRGSGPLDETRQIYQDCYERFAIRVDRAWAAANAPSEAELAAAREALAACLRAAGEEVPEAPSTQDFVRLQQTAEAFGECSQRVGEEYGIPYFAG